MTHHTPIPVPIAEALVANLRALESAYLAARPRKPGGFWKDASGNDKFMSRIDAGADFLAGSYDRVVQWCADNWPAGAEWPAGLARPPRSAEPPSCN